MEHAYLRNRQPLIPFQNVFSAVVMDDGLDLSYLERVAGIVYMYFSYRNLLSAEKIKPHRLRDGKVLSMDIYKKVYHSYRMPGEELDRLDCHFVLDTEKGSPDIENRSLGHVVVFKNGYVFKVDIVDEKNEPVKIKELIRQFKIIDDVCKSREEGPFVSALTATDRTTWAANRKKLAELSSRNAEFLELIETAFICVVVFDSEPKNGLEVGN